MIGKENPLDLKRAIETHENYLHNKHLQCKTMGRPTPNPSNE